jgi:MSHA biogenesis protein MshJ
MNNLNLKEKLLIVLALLVAGWAAWDVWSYGPLVAENMNSASTLSQLKANHKELLDEIELTPNIIRSSPRLEGHARATAQQDRRAQSRLQLARLAKNFIKPDELPRMLEQLLVESGGLTLVQVNLKAPSNYALTASVAQSPESTKTSMVRRARLLEHHAELIVKGTYHDVVEYLALLRRSPWRFFYSSLDYEVQNHPVGTATLQLYTLSFSEG